MSEKTCCSLKNLKKKLDFDISLFSLHRIVQDLDYNYGPREKVVFLTEKAVEKRLTHCKKVQ